MKQTIIETVKEYAMLTFATVLLVIGVYVFKFPNHFSFGGVTGIAVVLTAVMPVSATMLTNVINIARLVLGFAVLGRGFGVRTVYVTLLSTLGLWLMERFCPMDAPLTGQPVLELIFAIILPAFSAAILFNMDASSGGTDIIAMIIKRFASIDIGMALMITDALVAVSSFFVYDGVIENFNLCKFFTIVSENPEPIVKFIHEDLNRSATVYRAEGTYLHKDKTVILAVTKRRQAVLLRNFVKVQEPGAFLMITNSSEIIGKGFQGF